MDWEGRGGKGGGAGLPLELFAGQLLCLQEDLSRSPHPTIRPKPGGAPISGRNEEQENPTPCPETAWQSAMVVGWLQQVWDGAQESQNRTPGMPGSHWSIAFCLWDARLMEWGCTFGIGSFNTSWDTKTRRGYGGA